jgi:hypothetical protein
MRPSCIAGIEVALFVEDFGIGQALLAVGGTDGAAFEQSRRVVVATSPSFRMTDHHRQRCDGGELL